MMKLRSAALTHIGHLRAHNEDRYMQDDTLRLYGVADGVGGLPGGEEAAQRSVEEIAREIAAKANDSEPDLVTLVRVVNDRVVELGQVLSPGLGIGSTLTFGWFRDNRMLLAHIGDSRCYVFHDGKLELLTRDHSVENDARLRRARGETVYYHESHRNALTRCMGQPTPPEVDVISRPLVAGERYLLCTDGVTRLVTESEIAEAIGRGGEPAEVAKELVDLANRRGGPDNSTVVLVYVDAVA